MAWWRWSFGGLLLFDTDNEAFDISVPLVLLTAAVLGGFFVWIISKAVQARHAQVHTGSEELIGAQRQGALAARPVGHVFVKGALWRARSRTGGTRGRATRSWSSSVDGLTLTVAPAPAEA